MGVRTPGGSHARSVPRFAPPTQAPFPPSRHAVRPSDTGMGLPLDLDFPPGADRDPAAAVGTAFRPRAPPLPLRGIPRRRLALSRRHTHQNQPPTAADRTTRPPRWRDGDGLRLGPLTRGQLGRHALDQQQPAAKGQLLFPGENGPGRGGSCLPPLPQIRTCPIKASGSSDHGFTTHGGTQPRGHGRTSTSSSRLNRLHSHWPHRFRRISHFRHRRITS